MLNFSEFRLPKTITIYLLRELGSPFFLGLLIFTFVLLMQWVLDLIEMVISKGVNVTTVLELIVYIMPSFLVLTLPMGVLVATLTAFGRLSTDSEITAMKASGISFYTLYMPVFLFSFGVAATTFFLYADALPWGNHRFRVALYELARTKAVVGLKEHVFDTAFPNLVIYVDKISEGDSMFYGIMLADSRDSKNPQIIFAKKGTLISDEDALRVILRLYDGVSHPKNVVSPLKYQTVRFPVLDILLSFQGDDGDSSFSIPRTDRDMHIPQLVEQYGRLKDEMNPQPVPLDQDQAETVPSFFDAVIQVPHILWNSFFCQNRFASPYLVEIHKRFSFPFACLVFGLLGTPLGIQSRRAGKSGGYAISVALLLVYYIFITAGESLGDGGQMPAFWAVWTPNILLGVTGLILLLRMARR